MKRFFHVFAAIAVCLFCGTWPGAATVEVADNAPAHSAPAVPDSFGPRDAKLDVVVKTEAGQSVQNATITAYVMIDHRAHFAASARTDESGTARLAALPRGAHYVVTEHAGFARASTMVVTEPGARRLDVTLLPEHVLDVAIEDEAHAPVADAEIEVSANEPVPVGARSGDDGGAHVTRLAAGPFTVRVAAPGFEVVTREHVEEGATCRVTLAKLASLRVTVVDANDANVAHARVEIASASLYPPRAAETDDQGQVRIGGLSAGSYALRATHAATVSPVELSVTLARAEEKSVTLKLGTGATAEVIVTDAEDDEPLAGARVTLAEGGLSPFPLEAVTDKAGRALLGPYTPGRAVLTVRADGYVARSGIVVPDDGSAAKIALGKGATIEGRILDARGFPIDGATFVVVGNDVQGSPIDDDPRTRAFTSAHFSASLAGPVPLVPAGELGVVPGPVPPIPHAGSAFGLASSSSSAPVDAGEPWLSLRDGTFTLAPVTPGRVRILARHPEYTDAQSDTITIAPGATTHVDLVMRRGGTVEGRVVSSRGDPIAGAEVTVAATHGTMERGAKTAQDGSFAFASLPDTVTILVSAADDPGEPLARAVVEVKEDARTNVTLTLPEPRASLPVRVVDERGRAVGTAIVTAASIDPAQPLHATGFADTEGDLQIARAAGLALRLDVRAPGYASQRVAVAAQTATTAPKDPIKIELRAAVPVTGVVVSDRGDAIEGAEVTAYAELGAMHAVTDKDGTYHFAELGEGAIKLAARAKEHAPAETTATIVASRAGTPFSAPKLELAAEGIVTGVVVDEAGKPIAGARVAKDAVSTYLAFGAPPPTTATTTRDGKFRLGELPAGEVSLEALAPDVGRGRAQVHVDRGRTTADVRLVVVRADDEAAHDRAAGGVAVTLGETAEPKEVVIVAVAPASEAERAGLVPNDVVVEVDGHAVSNMVETRQKLSGPLADEVVVKVRRGDGTQIFRVPREPVRK